MLCILMTSFVLRKNWFVKFQNHSMANGKYSSDVLEIKFMIFVRPLISYL